MALSTASETFSGKLTLIPQPEISYRGQERVNRLGFSVPSDFKLFDPEKNPDGLINLGTAENSLLSETLLKVLLLLKCTGFPMLFAILLVYS